MIKSESIVKKQEADDLKNLLPCILPSYCFKGVLLDVHGHSDNANGCEIMAIYVTGSSIDIYEIIDSIPYAINKIETACDRATLVEEDESRADAAIAALQFE